MPQFNFLTYPSQIFWLCIIFFIQYLIVSKLIIPSFKKIYDTRKKYVDNQIKLANQIAAEAENIKNDYEQKLADAKAENIAKLDNAIAALQKSTDKTLNDVDTKLAKDFKQYEEKIDSMRDSIQKDLDDLAIESAVSILQRVSHAKTTKKDLIKYIN